MKRFLFLIIFAFIVLIPFVVQAGFGISPPYIKNDYLTPGSYFEETIYLVRSDSSEDMIVEAITDAPGFKNWITVNNEYILPKNQQQFPVKIGINVPTGAGYGTYQGSITIRKKLLPGDSSPALGAKIDIRLTVAGETLSDFKVKGVNVPDFEKGNSLVVLIVLENTGNTKIKPSKIHLDIYDIDHKKILKSGDITETELVEPFETKQISGEMQVDLEAGEYWADTSIYKDGKIVNTFKNYFRITPLVQKIAFPENEATREEREISFINIIIFILLIIMR